MAGMATGRHRKCLEKNEHPWKHQWTCLHYIGDFEFGVYPPFKSGQTVQIHQTSIIDNSRVFTIKEEHKWFYKWCYLDRSPSSPIQNIEKMLQNFSFSDFPFVWPYIWLEKNVVFLGWVLRSPHPGWILGPHLLKVKKKKSSQLKLWVFRERSWTGKLALGSLKLDQMLLWWARAQKLCKIRPF